MTTLLTLTIALPLIGAAVPCWADAPPTPGATCWGAPPSSAPSYQPGVVRTPAQPPAEHRMVHQTLFSWVPVGALHVDFGLQLDALSVCFLLLITGVGSLIHLYSIGYMADDPRPPAVLRLPQSVRRRDARAGSRRQLPRPVSGLGGWAWPPIC